MATRGSKGTTGTRGAPNAAGAVAKFHRPFETLKSLAPKLPGTPATPPVRPRLERGGRAVAPRPPAPLPDDLLFAQAMHGVQPLAPGPARVLATLTGRLPDPDAEDAEVRDELAALVSGEAAFRLSDGDEFMEGSVADLDKRTRLRLRRGEFALQAHLDLHGQTREEAHATLDGFLQTQRAHGHRCVLVIHGRGKNSKDQVPVLKEQMARWLTRGAAGKIVLGFCTARSCDGGPGAVYVLLRR